MVLPKSAMHLQSSLVPPSPACHMFLSFSAHPSVFWVTWASRAAPARSSTGSQTVSIMIVLHYSGTDLLASDLRCRSYDMVRYCHHIYSIPQGHEGARFRSSKAALLDKASTIRSILRCLHVLLYLHGTPMCSCRFEPLADTLHLQLTVQWMGRVLERFMGHRHLHHKLSALRLVPCPLHWSEALASGAFGQAFRDGLHQRHCRDRGRHI